MNIPWYVQWYVHHILFNFIKPYYKNQFFSHFLNILELLTARYLTKNIDYALI